MYKFTGGFDSETEVLTIFGWKKWDQVSYFDKLATRTVQGNIEYTSPTILASNNYKGKMYRVESGSVDLLTTPDHCLLIVNEDGSTALKKAEDLGTIMFRLTTSIKSPTLEPDSIDRHRLALCRLFGFLVARSAKFSYTNSGRIFIRKYKYKHFAYLRGIAQEAGTRLTQTNNKWYFDDIFSKVFGINCRLEDHGYTSDLVIPSILFSTLSHKEQEGILEGIVVGRGYPFKGSVILNITSSRLVNQL